MKLDIYLSTDINNFLSLFSHILIEGTSHEVRGTLNKILNNSYLSLQIRKYFLVEFQLFGGPFHQQGTSLPVLYPEE